MLVKFAGGAMGATDRVAPVCVIVGRLYDLWRHAQCGHTFTCSTTRVAGDAGPVLSYQVRQGTPPPHRSMKRLPIAQPLTDRLPRGIVRGAAGRGESAALVQAMGSLVLVLVCPKVDSVATTLRGL